MSRKRYRPEEVIAKLREADAPLSHGTEAGDGFPPCQRAGPQKSHQKACSSTGTPQWIVLELPRGREPKESEHSS